MTQLYTGISTPKRINHISSLEIRLALNPALELREYTDTETEASDSTILTSMRRDARPAYVHCSPKKLSTSGPPRGAIQRALQDYYRIYAKATTTENMQTYPALTGGEGRACFAALLSPKRPPGCCGRGGLRKAGRHGRAIFYELVVVTEAGSSEKVVRSGSLLSHGEGLVDCWGWEPLLLAAGRTDCQVVWLDSGLRV